MYFKTLKICSRFNPTIPLQNIVKFIYIHFHLSITYNPKFLKVKWNTDGVSTGLFIARALKFFKRAKYA